MSEGTPTLSEGASELGGESESHSSKLLGLEPGQWLKLIGLAVVIYIVYSVVVSFRSAANNPAFKNLGDAFTSATGALAWASSHWYLFMAGFLIAPFLPAASRWAAQKLSDAQRTGKLSKGALERVSDAIVYTKVTEELEQTDLDPAKRAQLETTQSDAQASFNNGDAADKADATEWANANDVTVPPEKARRS